MKHRYPDTVTLSHEAINASREMHNVPLVTGGQGRTGDEIVDGALLLAAVFAAGTTILLAMALIELFFL